MNPFDRLLSSVAVRGGRRPTVYQTMDEAIFAIEGCPDAEFTKCKFYEEAANYLELEPMEYPRWFRIVVWPETAGDWSEPTIPEAPSAEFRKAYVRMRQMGYPEDRFPAWFIEKIPEDDWELGPQAIQAPTTTQSDWVIQFRPNKLTQPHRRYGTAAENAAAVARALAARAQILLRSNIPLRQSIDNPRHRKFQVTSGCNYAGAVTSASLDGEVSQVPGHLQHDPSTSWVTGRMSGPEPSPNRGSNPSMVESGSSNFHEEVNPALTSAPRSTYVAPKIHTQLLACTIDLPPTYALILGVPGREDEAPIRDSIPALDLLGISDPERHLKLVDSCLGQAASRYFHLHYYSRDSRAAVVRAYWYHHSDSEKFVKHLVHRGVLPMLGLYIWELLHTSFNWEEAIKAGIGGGGPEGPGTSYQVVSVGTLDFRDCPECRDHGRLVQLNDDQSSKGKGKVYE